MTGQLKILVVDDDVDNALSLGELFELEGHDVRVVHSGQAAIDAYLNTSFDLAFMDVMMPGKNGVESFIEIRRMKPTARVFMMTGFSVEELLQQATHEGAMGVIEKPMDAEEILRMTKSVGAGGLLVAAPSASSGHTGEAIRAALSSNGHDCTLVKHASDAEKVPDGSVVVLNTPVPLIDSVSCYANFRRQLKSLTTIIVPHVTRSFGREDGHWDVGVTGILNKPFDPLNLINRLPQLAA